MLETMRLGIGPLRGGRGGRRRQRAGFTLVELLAVIAVLAVLLSLLMPILQRGFYVAKKTKCLAERQGWGVAAFSFASDHNDRAPRGIDDYSSGNREIADHAMIVSGHHRGSKGRAMVVFHVGGYGAPYRVDPPGVLPALGYIDNLDMLYCPGWVGPNLDKGSNSVYKANYYMHRLRELYEQGTVWKNVYRWFDGEKLIDGDNDVPAHDDDAGISGVTNMLYGGDLWGLPYEHPEAGGEMRDGAYRMRISDINMNWARSQEYTPLMYVCAQGGGMRSHEGNGTNAVFCDGSARWISQDEMAGYFQQHWGFRPDFPLGNVGFYAGRPGDFRGRSPAPTLYYHYLSTDGP